MSRLPAKVEELVKEVFAHIGPITRKDVEEDPEVYLISLLTEIDERMARARPGELLSAVESASGVKSKELLQQAHQRVQARKEQKRRA